MGFRTLSLHGSRNLLGEKREAQPLFVAPRLAFSEGAEHQPESLRIGNGEHDIGHPHLPQPFAGRKRSIDLTQDIGELDESCLRDRGQEGRSIAEVAVRSVVRDIRRARQLAKTDRLHATLLKHSPGGNGQRAPQIAVPIFIISFSSQPQY